MMAGTHGLSSNALTGQRHRCDMDVTPPIFQAGTMQQASAARILQHDRLLPRP